MKSHFEHFSLYLFAASLLFCACFAHAQVPAFASPVPVALGPNPHPQFVDASGNLLAGGFLYTYAAGTNTLLNTYTDGSGSAQNPDPIPLDATGAPTNGSQQTGLWLANAAYKFCAYNSTMLQQWCTDNVTSYFGLLNDANVDLQQTFSLPIAISATEQQFVLGASGNQTALDFPPPTSNIDLEFPNTADTIVGRNTTDTLQNKTLLNPVVNGCTMTGEPGTYACIGNAFSTGTTLNTLTKLTTFNTAIIASTSDTGGVIGITTLGAGVAGTAPFATIQSSGVGVCTYDGTPTNGDYVQISSTTTGNCHDAGSAYPTLGQVIGRVINATATPPGIFLFGPEMQSSSAFGAATPTLAAFNGAGTGPTISLTAGSRDSGGIVAIVTGTSPASNSAIFQLTFGATHASAFCTFAPANNSNAMGAPVSVTSGGTGTSKFQLSATTALSGSAAYVWAYSCTFT